MQIWIGELLDTDAACVKLGARGITVGEANQLLFNGYEVKRNPGDRSRAEKRFRLIGRTDGGRPLTVVVEETIDPTTWLIVTGWEN
jgi:uncharacterized DUF497 family protein